MKQDLWSIIDEIEAAVTDGMHLPLSDRVVISEQEFFTLLDELRSVLPEEIAEARSIVMERERILSDAKSQADRTVGEAKEYAAELTSESKIKQQAEEEAKHRIEEAEEIAGQIREEAYRYADDVLKQIHGVMQKALERVAEGRKELRIASESKKARQQAALTKNRKARGTAPNSK